MKTNHKFKYGQWTITITLKDYTTYEPYCTIDCTGTWYSTQGSFWEDWVCPRYYEPYLLSAKLKDIIHAKCLRLIQATN